MPGRLKGGHAPTFGTRANEVKQHLARETACQSNTVSGKMQKL